MSATAVYTGFTGDLFVDGVLYGTKWTGPLTYSFADTVSDFGPNYRFTFGGFGELNAAQQFAIRYILGDSDPTAATPLAFTYGSFTDVSNLDITYVANPSTPTTMVLAEAFSVQDSKGVVNANPIPTAFGMFPDPADPSDQAAGDVIFGTQGSQYRDPRAGNFAWATHIHEIGHALGLKHGHRADAGLNDRGPEYRIPAWRDSLDYSVMTYSGSPNSFVTNYSVEKYGFPQTLMMLDIAAVQHLYGANFTTNATGTVYTWSPTTGEMFVNGVGQGLPGAGDTSFDSNKIFLTIWDGGGIDTYDMSNYAADLHIDLAPGESSRMDPAQRAVTHLRPIQVGVEPAEALIAQGNVFNALLYEGDTRSLIENATGGSGNDWLDGNQANNVLVGNDGNDVLNGREGADLLRGGAGDDVLLGDRRSLLGFDGPGFVNVPFGQAMNSPQTAFDLTPYIGTVESANVFLSATNPHVSAIVTADNNGYDAFRIYVGAPGVVIIDIDNASFQGFDALVELFDANLTPLASSDESGVDPGSRQDMASGQGDPGSEDPYISFGVNTPGWYYITVDDTLSRGVFAGGYTLSVTLPVLSENLGNEGNDILIGDSGSDTLRGHGGNDLLEGGADADDIDGGDGIDTATYASSALGVAVNLFTGTGSAGDADGDTLANVENLIGSGRADSLFGDGMANNLSGGSGNDRLVGLAGNDTLVGGFGADRLEGGSGSDVASYVFATSGVTVSLTTGAGTRGEANGDILTDIESLAGSNFGDDLTGDNGANLLRGFNGNDRLIGGGGGDRIYGDGGADVIAGGAGADLVFGGAGNDLVVGGTEADRIFGQAGDDRFVADADGANDRYDGGADADTMDYSSMTIGLSVNLFTGKATSAQIGTDTLVSVERVLGGSGNDAILGNGATRLISGNGGSDLLTGGAGANVIFGGLGNDTLRGLGGNDTLVGGQDQDVLEGGAGNDTFLADADGANDRYDGGANIDTMDFSAMAAALTINLVVQAATSAQIGSDILTAIERVLGGDGNDAILGDASTVFLSGNGGADRLTGGAGNNSLFGGLGNDILRGMGGNDRLNGAVGDDRLEGGAGSDIFVFGNGFGRDVVTDFDEFSAAEKIDLSAVTAISSFADLQANHLSQVGANALITDGANTITLNNVLINNLDAGDFIF